MSELLDDILVFGETKQQHDIRLRRVMASSQASDSIKKNASCLNPSWTWMGQVVSKDALNQAQRELPLLETW